MKDKLTHNKKKLIILMVILSLLLFLYGLLTLISYKNLNKYDKAVLPGVFLEEFDLSNYKYDALPEDFKFYEDGILNREINFKINSQNYKYKLKDLGVSIDYQRIINKIKNYQEELNYVEKIRFVNNLENKEFKLLYSIDLSKLQLFLDSIKSNVDLEVSNGYFDTSSGVKYISGVDGFSLNILESSKIINDIFKEEVNYNQVIELVGDTNKAISNDSFKAIDTMVSSFVTKFNVYEGTRPINLRNALNYINGAIVKPGEIFSFFNYAGPYNKKGYVFYYEFVGNGVCQIATTVYNTALLGGLEIVKRYPHAKQSVYVPGGLDATVASYSSGWNVDFQFKNTYKYPIYVKAYALGNEAHVEFWSNSNAKEGKTYSTESVKIGKRGYRTFLHTYKDGVEINKSEIATTWYVED